MIDLGSTDFLIQVPSLPEAKLASLSTSLFDSWESYVEGSLSIPDYSLFLQVEEGSIKGLAKMGAVLYAVYLGIGNYGDFISAIKTINEQLNATREYLAEEAARTFPCQESNTTTRKRGGSLAALQRLFVKVQRGELTPNDAMAQAETLLGNEAATVPGFQRDLENALRTCPRFPEQLSLPLSDLPEDELQTLLDSKRPSRTPRPKPVLGPTLQLRVEVWRESKSKRKETRIIRL
ncbi:MAG: hypothetical protein NT159_22890 [Proteobacteria bacterium]|nr:hypothetical protein [Pseudomonadota bacterium]